MVLARTGSAPLKATRTELRSRLAARRGSKRSTQSWKPKLGPPMLVGRNAVVASNHRIGSVRKATGDMNVPSLARNSGCRTIPMSPRSCDIGIQERASDVLSWPKARAIISSLAIRLSCVTITPLGRPVDPDVYWRNASGGTAGTSSGSPEQRSSGISSIAIHSPGSGTPWRAATSRSASRSETVVNTHRAPQSWLI
jgi:hypothetical protein